MAEVAPALGSEIWRELASLSRDEAGERAFLERLLELWGAVHGARAVALYLKQGEVLDLECSTGGRAFPEELEPGRPPAGFGSLPLPGGALLAAPAEAVEAARRAVDDPLTLLLATAARSCALRRQLKQQDFQAKYRGVELEALYDVGLAVAATLDLAQLSEEILLRAVSLLDARRGVLYLLEGRVYRPASTFGGDAGPAFPADDGDVAAFLAGEEPPAVLLPGARYILALPIAIEESPRGILAVGDRESRRGVGPFQVADRRTLSLFANQAAIALENARLHLEALEKERLERELDLAAEIQRQILPKGAPPVPGYDLVGWNRPARQVGGDYYDLLPLEDGRVILAVGDVSGKGMPAALMVSTLHAALRLMLDRTGPGAEFLERLNRHLLESSTANKFVTMLLADLDPGPGELRWFNAGHNPGLLLRRDGGVDQLGPGGLPLGLLPGSRYQASAIEIRPGDLLCLYTDGITEAESPTDEEYGVTRLVGCLQEHRHRPLQEIVDEIDRAVTHFAEGLPQRDDQTVVLLRREG